MRGNIALVTSWSEEGYDLYGKRFLEGFEKYWPHDGRLRLFVYSEMHGNETTWRDHHSLLPMPGTLKWWKEEFGNHPKADGRHGFKWNAARFANKVFSILDCWLWRGSFYEYVVWIDGDVVTHSPVTEDFLDLVFPGHTHLASILDRREFPECGFMAFNMKHPAIGDFMADWSHRYESGEILDYDQTHDSYVFKILVQDWRAKGMKFYSLCPYDVPDGDHVFVNSHLGLCMDHLKGARKYVGSSVVHDLRQSWQMRIPYWREVGTTTHGELERIKREKGLT